MRIRSIVLSSLAFALAVSAAPAFGARDGTTRPSTRPARDPEKAFGRIDTDHDGLISKTEFEAFIAQAAERRDKGKEPKNGGPMAKGDAIFAKLDADKDGSLSPEEFAKLPEVRREAADRGGKGTKPGKAAKRAKPNV